MMTQGSNPEIHAGTQRPGGEPRFGRLQEGAPLGLHVDACLAVRSKHSGCRSCEMICPVKVLTVIGGEGLALAEGCLGCGRCAAACPTGALAVPGFGGATVAARGPALAVDCWKVPRERSGSDALRVPCLGGLSAGWLLELRADARERPLALMDRGWCGECSAGCRKAHPAARTVERVNALLAEAGVPAELHVRIEASRLPADRLPERIPDADAARDIGRRAFFASLAGRVTATVNDIVQIVPGGEDAGEPDRRGHIRSRERERILAAMHRIATHWRRPMPRSLFDGLQVSDACRNHGVCAATCPTGALHGYEAEEGSVRGIAFDGWLCIGCGHCEEVCPERAVTMTRGGGQGVPDGAQRLTRFHRAACAECGTAISAGEGEDEMLCTNCRKRRDLARSAFQTLFGGARH